MAPKIRSDVTVQQVGDEALVLSLASEQIHQLNATAAWILAQCDGEKSVDAIADEFAEYFSLDPQTASNDVASTIEQLHQVNVIDLE